MLIAMLWEYYIFNPYIFKQDYSLGRFAGVASLEGFAQTCRCS